ncbi:hypothetical protein [Nonomuraea sp. NPDC050643]|uniref:hypothetical protein n=1 Tax=Nonomuraea sp. NPDC050643 TaxID=3155660 RepID=UPI0033D6BC92
MPESTENKPPIGIPPTGTLGGAAPTGDEQELARLRAKIAALTQRIRSLEQLLKPHEDLVRLHAELRDRQRAADAADRLFQQARAEAEVRRSRIYQFSARFQEILNKVPSPWFRGAAHIDPDTYLPVIEDEEVKEMTGSVRTIAIIAYHLAMLSYGLEHRDTYVPQTLILDSPQRNLGNNAEDRLHARRLYASLNLHTLARQQLNMTLGDDLALPPVQVIVADNDIPLRAIGSPVIRHTFTRENPFVPGVVYEEHPEDFEPEADLLA